MGNKIKVELVDSMGSDLKVCQMAKDSFGRTTHLGPDGDLLPGDKRLLKMLSRGMGEAEYNDVIASGDVWRFKRTTPHLAPLGHCFATFQFEAPVFVMRHIVKHEYIRISEISMRYVRGMPDYFRPKSWRARAEDVKQGSGGDMEVWLQKFLHMTVEGCHHMDSEGYHDDLEDGLCPEQARMFLRLCHMTQGHLSGSMDALANLVIQRLDPHAQEETRELARQIDNQMGVRFPLAWSALTEGVVRS